MPIPPYRRVTGCVVANDGLRDELSLLPGLYQPDRLLNSRTAELSLSKRSSFSGPAGPAVLATSKGGWLLPILGRGD